MTSPSCASSSSIPLRKDDLLEILSVFPEGTPVVWVQEEPKNLGAWAYMNRELPRVAGRIVSLVVRQPPAVGEPGDGLGEAARARAGAARGRGARQQARSQRRGRLMSLTLRVPALGESVHGGDARRLEARRGGRGRRRRAAGRGREREGDARGAVARARACCARSCARRGRRSRWATPSPRSIRLGARAPAKPKAEPAAPAPRGRRRATARSRATARVRAAPSARRALADSGLSPAEIAGTGRGGRISKQDVDRTLEERAHPPAAERRARARRDPGEPFAPRPSRETARASGSSRCRRCAARWPGGWSRPSTPPRSSPPSTRST